MKDILPSMRCYQGFLVTAHFCLQWHAVSLGLFTWITVLFITRFHAMNFLMSLGL